ncbi:MAG: HAD family hydrolase [Planctomycetota bacterium]
MTKLLILDFDGTMTDAEAEGGPFRTGYLEDLAALTGRELPEIEALAARFEAQVREDPGSHGWVYGGQIVAPAIVDPYLRIMPVARKIFDETGSFADESDRTRLLDAILYKYNYKKTRTVFREGAAHALQSLAGTEAYIVTNSHTEPVRNKVRTLDKQLGGEGELSWLIERVHGRAKKYVIDETFDAVPESIDLPGLERPVLLRRRQYYDVLSELLERHNATWSEMLVIGDIYELDLALPLAMGARVGLVTSPFTPEYEKEFLGGHARGKLVDSLYDIPALLGTSTA